MSSERLRERARWLRFARELSVFILLALVLAAPSHAEQMSLQEFGQGDGLQNLAVTSLAQDSAGFIWVGTQNGVFRFDGVRFERIGADEKLASVTALVVDGARTWIAADEGLWLWQDERLQRIVPADGPLTVSAYPQTIAPDGAGLWVVSNWRLVELMPGPGGAWRKREVLDESQGIGRRERESVSSVAIGNDGDVWFGCGRRICRRHAGRYEIWGTERGVPEEPWHWLLRGSDGSLWARGSRHVLQLAAGGRSFADRTDIHDGEDPLGLYPLLEDAQHRILGAGRGALERHDGRGWDRFDVAAGLPAGGRLRALLRDREGGLWMGMMGAGVFRWRGYGQWENWSVESGLPHTAVWRFARAGPPGRQALYAATGAGVAAFDAQAGRFRAIASTAGQETMALASDEHGGLWAGTSHGRLLRLTLPGPGGSVELPRKASVYNLFSQRAGDLWIVSDAGLHHRAPGSSTLALVSPADTGQPTDQPLSDGCEGRDGAQWFGGAKGLVRYARGHWDRLSRSGVDVTALACLRDGTLAATSGTDGVHILALEGATLNDRDVTPPALRSRRIEAMLEDSRSWLWVATDAGVAVWNRQHWRMLDRSSGLVWNDTSSGALYEDADGSIWIGTSRGASHVLAPQVLFAPVASAISIQSFARGDRELRRDQAIRLPWSPEQLNIDLAVTIYADRRALDVEYRLLGFDDRWTATAHLDVRLTGLPAGRYRFEARTVDRDLGVSSPVSGLDFDIDPPWWRSNLALAIMALVGSMAAYASYRWRMQVLTSRARQLEVLVRERTRELEESREQLREQATKDGLTGVWNRRALMEILAREANRCARERMPLAVALADIDHFKQVNDTHGHPAGDAVLREFAGRLAAGIRPYDAVGRYGGEEFVLVMPGLDITQAEHRARLMAIHESIGASPMTIGTVTCSFGIAGTDGTAPVDVDTLIATADEALYRAKRNGRDRIEWSPCASSPGDVRPAAAP